MYSPVYWWVTEVDGVKYYVYVTAGQTLPEYTPPSPNWKRAVITNLSHPCKWVSRTPAPFKEEFFKPMPTMFYGLYGPNYDRESLKTV